MKTAARSNWLNQFRLCFAIFVIFSHSFDLLLNDSEPLRVVTKSASFSRLGVCSFFVLSGYLISKSWRNNPDLAAYLRNRLLRIWPAFAVAFVLSVAIVGGLRSGEPLAYYRALDFPRLAADLLSLHQPSAPYPPPFHNVNGSMWTIKWEFLCYLLTPLLIARRAIVASVWLALAAIDYHWPCVQTMWLLMFASGAAYQTFGVTPKDHFLLLCAAVLPLTLFSHATSEIGLAIAGTYLLLGVGLRETARWKLPDISYGVYLYGWPIQKLLIMAGVMNPWLLFAVTLPLSIVAGAASWYGVERWALALKRGRPDSLRLTPSAMQLR